MHAKLLQSRLTLCDPMVCSPPGSPVYGISQARIRNWVAIFCSKGSSRPRDGTQVSCGSCIVGGFFTTESLSSQWPSGLNRGQVLGGSRRGDSGCLNKNGTEQTLASESPTGSSKPGLLEHKHIEKMECVELLLNLSQSTTGQ